MLQLSIRCPRVAATQGGSMQRMRGRGLPGVVAIFCLLFVGLFLGQLFSRIIAQDPPSDGAMRCRMLGAVILLLWFQCSAEHLVVGMVGEGFVALPAEGGLPSGLGRPHSDQLARARSQGCGFTLRNAYLQWRWKYLVLGHRLRLVARAAWLWQPQAVAT